MAENGGRGTAKEGVHGIILQSKEFRWQRYVHDDQSGGGVTHFGSVNEKQL